MNKKIVLLLSLLFIFLVAFGGTLFYLDRQKVKTGTSGVVEQNEDLTPSDNLERTGVVEQNEDLTPSDNLDKNRIVELKISGEIVCIDLSGQIVSSSENKECLIGIKESDSSLYYIVYPEDFKDSDKSIFKHGNLLTISGKVVKSGEDGLEAILVEDFELLR